jgi:hypothetical protein
MVSLDLHLENRPNKIKAAEYWPPRLQPLLLIHSVIPQVHVCLQESHHGILLTKVSPTGSANGILHRGDVLMQFDGASISCDATTQVHTLCRLQAPVMVCKLEDSGCVSVCLLL